jgi:hypothetical protein
MSWSKSGSGTAEEVAEQVERWKGEVKESDERYSSSDGIKKGHDQQLNAVAEVISKIGATFPDKKLAVIANGHANDDGSGNVGLNYSFSASRA